MLLTFKQNLKNMCYIFFRSESTMGPSWLGMEKNFKIEVLRWLEYATLRLVLLNTVFHKREILNFNRRAMTGNSTENSFSLYFMPHFQSSLE